MKIGLGHKQAKKLELYSGGTFGEDDILVRTMMKSILVVLDHNTYSRLLECDKILDNSHSSLVRNTGL